MEHKPVPVFFLSFANDSKDLLPGLEKESEQIYRLLSPAAVEQLIQIHREPFASPENIAHYLMQFRGRVSLFHYGGHANGQALFLREQTALADGLAEQLKQEEALKLVFLNGCSTRPQVSRLLALGIPTVIATSAPIGDQEALLFASQFYKAIAAGFTIRTAFQTAAAILKTQSDLFPQIYRGLWSEKNSTSVLPWGLYVNKEDKILDYQLIPRKIANPSEKNMIKNQFLSIDGNISLGDKNNISAKQPHRKNIIEGGRMQVKGDINLGDTN